MDPQRICRRLVIALALLYALGARAAEPLPTVILPDPGLRPEQVAIVINTRDALSWSIGDYYRRLHTVPPRNMIHVAFDPTETVMHPGEFAVMKRVLDAKTPATIQAYVLTWAQPYRVGCMSMTSAFAFGYDHRYCAKGCRYTAVNPYADSDSLRPWDDFGIRPAMMLATPSLSAAKALINRGVLSQGWYFHGPVKRPAAYLVETPDKNRSVRKVFFPAIARRFGRLLDINIERSEGIEGADDILFYFTGDRFVKGLDNNRYLPGAVADHLTSSGGKLTDSIQMSAMDWLRAGATGSYGTVVEPCNYLQKFPNPERLMAQYLAGRTLIEAYWKSVLMPGQGVFIGDPLAAPFKGYRLLEKDGAIDVQTAQLLPGVYRLLGADRAEGPYEDLATTVAVSAGLQHFTLKPPYRRFYRLQRAYALPGESLQFMPPTSP